MYKEDVDMMGILREQKIYILGYSRSVSSLLWLQSAINCLSSLPVKSKLIAFDYDFEDRFFSCNVVFDC